MLCNMFILCRTIDSLDNCDKGIQEWVHYILVISLRPIMVQIQWNIVYEDS